MKKEINSVTHWHTFWCVYFHFHSDSFQSSISTSYFFSLLDRIFSCVYVALESSASNYNYKPLGLSFYWQFFSSSSSISWLILECSKSHILYSVSIQRIWWANKSISAHLNKQKWDSLNVETFFLQIYFHSEIWQCGIAIAWSCGFRR